MQRTEKYFEQNAYRREAVGHILAAEPDSRTGGGRIALDGTVFYPEGGGQPADRGTLTLADGTVLTVTDVHEQAGVIWHMVTSLPAGAVPGAEAAQAIDWAWRFDKMQQHTASTSSPASCTACSGPRTWASTSAPMPCGWTRTSPSPPRG